MTAVTAARNLTERIHAFWNEASCGTQRATAPKHTLEYFEQIEEFRYRHEPFIHSFAQFSRRHGMRVLEVGVGAGTDFLQWVRVGAEAHGVDLTEEAIENTEKRLETYGLAAASLRVCNAERLSFPDDYFDFVFSWGVIHHAADMAAVLAEMHRVTRPGGDLKFMVYNRNSLYAWYLYVRHALLRGAPHRGRRWVIARYQESPHTKAYSRRDVERMLGRLNCSSVRFELWDQLVRDGARYAPLRRAAARLLPEAWRWYMCVDARKLSTAD